MKLLYNIEINHLEQCGNGGSTQAKGRAKATRELKQSGVSISDIRVLARQGEPALVVQKLKEKGVSEDIIETEKIRAEEIAGIKNTKEKKTTRAKLYTQSGNALRKVGITSNQADNLWRSSTLDEELRKRGVSERFIQAENIRREERGLRKWEVVE